MAAIRSSQSNFWPMCMAKARNGDIIGVNGLNRGFLYQGGFTSAAWDLGIDAPSAVHSVATPATVSAALGSGAGDATAGEYITAYRYLDDTLPNHVPSSLSPSVTVTAAENDAFEHTSIVYSANTRVKYVEIWRSTMGQSTAVYLVTTIGNNGSYTSVADNGSSKCRFTWAGVQPHNLVIGARITISAANHVVTAVTTTTFDTDVAIGSAPSAPGTWVLNGFMNDVLSDTTLQARTSMRILTGAGYVNARRFVPPPDHKPYVCFFQDRAFYAGVVPYNVGTVANSSGTVTGTGTAWTSGMVGRYLIVDGKQYPISAVASATELTITGYQGASFSGSSYVIVPAGEERNTLYYSEQDEPESVPATNIVAVQENTGDDDEITGLMPEGANLYVLKERHIYRCSFFAQPIIDVSIALVTKRGCVNNRCWCRHEDAAYLMDQSGIYRFTGGSAESISQPIDDVFRNGTIDWSVKKWFFAQADPVQEVVRFHVSYIGDSSTRPKRWLEYNIRTQTWQTGSCLVELGSACLASISGRTRVLVGAENDAIYLFGEGTSDHVTSATRGTVTSATATTLTDSTASFAATVIDAPVAIIAGTGKGQIRRITARSTTELTVATWTTTPDATSKYLVGAIAFNMKTGLMHFVGNTKNEVQRQMRLTYEPVNGEQTVDLRRYLDHNPTADNNKMTTNPGCGVTTTLGDPSGVLDMDRTASSLGTSYVGYDVYSTPGRLDPDSAAGPRSMRAEIVGYQGDKEVKFYQLEVLGVAD